MYWMIILAYCINNLSSWLFFFIQLELHFFLFPFVSALAEPMSPKEHFDCLKMMQAISFDANYLLMYEYYSVVSLLIGWLFLPTVWAISHPDSSSSFISSFLFIPLCLWPCWANGSKQALTVWRGGRPACFGANYLLMYKLSGILAQWMIILAYCMNYLSSWLFFFLTFSLSFYSPLSLPSLTQWVQTSIDCLTRRQRQ